MQLVNALIRLRVCAGWSEPLLVAHTTLLKISCRGSNMSKVKAFLASVDYCRLLKTFENGLGQDLDRSGSKPSDTLNVLLEFF